MDTILKRMNTRPVWRLLESPVVHALIGESTFDFYATLLSPRFTARRTMARVEHIRDEAHDVRSFVLRPNGHFRGFRAGQHVNLTVEIEGVRQTRTYSPSNRPDRTGSVVLTVKRHPGGRISSWLHDNLNAGDWVELGQAFGDFTLPSPAPEKLLLVAGGSGITPIASLLRDLCARGQANDVIVLVYARTASDLIFEHDLRALDACHPGIRVHCITTRVPAANAELVGRFSVVHLDRVVPDAAERHGFACGPLGLVTTVRQLWIERQVPLPLKTETFDPIQAVGSHDDNEISIVRVDATRTARSFSANTAAPLLAQAEQAGLSPASGCRQGICFSCACRKRKGVVRNVLTGAISSEPDEDIRLCISAPLSDVALDL